jgi:hypothetical protein
MSIANLLTQNNYKLYVNTPPSGINVDGTQLKSTEQEDKKEYELVLPPLVDYTAPVGAVGVITGTRDEFEDKITLNWLSTIPGGVIPDPLIVNNLEVNQSAAIVGNLDVEGSTTLENVIVSTSAEFNEDITVYNNANILNLRISNPAYNNYSKIGYNGNQVINYNLPLTQTASENIQYYMTATRTGANTQLNLTDQTLAPIVGPKSFYFLKEPTLPSTFIKQFTQASPTYTTSFTIDKNVGVFYYLTLKFRGKKTGGSNWDNTVSFTGTNFESQSVSTNYFLLYNETNNEVWTYNYNHIIQILDQVPGNTQINVNYSALMETAQAQWELQNVEVILTPITNVFSATPV